LAEVFLTQLAIK